MKLKTSVVKIQGKMTVNPCTPPKTNSHLTSMAYTDEPLADDSWVEQYLRRQFTRLIHGRLKEKRILLPACAYHAIRTAFSEKDADFTGYDDLQ